MRPITDVTAIQRVVRLLFMVGMVIAAYLVLSLFDRAARADTGVMDHIAKANPAASAKGLVADAKKARPPVKVQAPKVSTSKAPKAPKVVKAKAASKVASAKTAARTVVSRPSKVVAGRADHKDLTRVRTAPKAPAPPDLSTLPEIPSEAALPALPRLELSTLPRWELPAPLPALPRLAACPEPPALPMLAQSPVLAQPPLVAAATTVLTSPLPTMPPGVTHPPPAHEPGDLSGPATAQLDRVAPGRPGAKPVPGPPEHPGNQSTTTGHVRDSGGGNAPTTGTVSSSWRPDLVAAGIGAPADLIVRGRTVRYSGPPS
jgi:hypothetical protein